MYCTLNDAYGSSIAGLSDLTSQFESCHQRSQFDDDTRSQISHISTHVSQNSQDSTHSNKNKKHKIDDIDHKFYIEQFELLKNDTIEILHRDDKISIFNETFDHINDCKSCRLYLEKKKNIQEQKSFVFDIKDLLMLVFFGIIIIILIELIVRLSV